MIEKLFTVLAILALVFPTSAFSIELGNIEVYSRFGEPLLARIPVDASDIRDRASIDVRLSQPKESSLFAADTSQWFLDKLRFRLVLDDHGIGHIEVTTRKTVPDVYVKFVLKIHWRKGELLRKYEIILDLPSPHRETDPPPPAAPPTNRPTVVVATPTPEKKKPARTAQPMSARNQAKGATSRTIRASNLLAESNGESDAPPPLAFQRKTAHPVKSAGDTGKQSGSSSMANSVAKGKMEPETDYKKQTQIRATPASPAPMVQAHRPTTTSRPQTTPRLYQDRHGTESEPQDNSVWWLALGSALLGGVLVLAVITALVRWDVITPEKKGD